MTCPLCHSAVLRSLSDGPVYHATVRCKCTTGEGFGEIGEARTVALKMWCWRVNHMIDMIYGDFDN